MKANSPRIKFLRTITKCIKERKCCRPFAYAHHKLLLWRSRCRRCAVARTAQLRHLHCDYSNLVTLSSVGKLRLLKWNSQDMISEFRKRKNISSRLVHRGRIGRKILRGRNYFLIFYSFELELFRKCTNVKNCLEKLNCFRRYSILKCTYVSKTSSKMAGDSKIKA